MSIARIAFLFAFLVSCHLPVWAESPEGWLRRWNSEKGRAIKLTKENTLFKQADADLFVGLTSVGFRQSDGRYTLGRVIWAGKDWSPLAGMGAILKDSKFDTLDDAQRLDLFLTLVSQIQGSLGITPYEGEPSRQKHRPMPIYGERGADGSHRFVVWYSLFPSNRETSEWRKILYFVSPDGSSVKARTLSTYHPEAERLRGFPKRP